MNIVSRYFKFYPYIFSFICYNKHSYIFKFSCFKYELHTTSFAQFLSRMRFGELLHFYCFIFYGFNFCIFFLFLFLLLIDNNITATLRYFSKSNRDYSLTSYLYYHRKFACTAYILCAPLGYVLAPATGYRNDIIAYILICNTM